jgi:hypothetical protein
MFGSCTFVHSQDTFNFFSIISTEIGIFKTHVFYLLFNTLLTDWNTHFCIIWPEFELSFSVLNCNYYKCTCIWYWITRHEGSLWSWSYGSWIYYYLCNQCLSPLSCEFQGRIQDFKLGGFHLKKIAPSRGRHEIFWVISCEKSWFYAKKSYFFPIAEGGAKIFGVFRVKNHDFTPKNHIFPNFRGGGARRVRPPPGSTPEFEPRAWRGVMDTTWLCDKVCQWLATGRWFSPVSSTNINKTDRHDIAEILLKVALNNINQNKPTRDEILLHLRPSISQSHYHLFTMFARAW